MTTGRDDPGSGRPREPDDPRERAPWEGRRLQFRIRTLMLAVAVVAVWLPVMRDPVLGRLVGGAVVLVASVLLGTMGLSLIGLGLSALGDRAVAWVRRVARWPEEPD